MPHPITLNLPDDLYESLNRMAVVAELPVGELASLWIAQRVKSIDDDPLLKLSGCVDQPPGSPPLSEPGEEDLAVSEGSLSAEQEPVAPA